MTTIKIDSMFVPRNLIREGLRDFSAYAVVNGYFGYEQYRNGRPFQTIVAGHYEGMSFEKQTAYVKTRHARPDEHEAIKKCFLDAGFVEPIFVWEKRIK